MSFTPEEKAYYERRKAESERPLPERVPQWARVLGIMAGFALVFGAVYWLLPK